MKRRKLTQSDSLFKNIREIIEQSQSFAYQAVNFAMVHSYFKVGQCIVENEQSGNLRAEYAQKTLSKLSSKLVRHFGRGFSVDNLENMRRFYLLYGDDRAKFLPQIPSQKKKLEISESLIRKFNPSPSSKKSESLIRKSNAPAFRLSWTHYLLLMRIDNENERKFYEIEAANESWSVRELKRQYNSGLYERLILSRDKKKVKELSKKGLVIQNPQDAIKEHAVLEFLNLHEKNFYSESDLEQAIINKLEAFLLELGKGFFFVARQKRISINEKNYRIDLVFYHRFLNCFVLIDLKIGEVTPKDIGQMQLYVGYYDQNIKKKEENKTIGVILCKDKDENMVKYLLPDKDKQIYTSKFRLYFPKEEEWQHVMEGEVEYVKNAHRNDD